MAAAHPTRSTLDAAVNDGSGANPVVRSRWQRGPSKSQVGNLPITKRPFNKTLVFYVRPKFARATKLSEPATS
jgi:hypothetical protein